MRQFNILLAASLTHHDDIDVDGPRPLGDHAFPPKALLNGQNPVQQGHRLQRGLRHHHEVEVIVLFWPLSCEWRLIDGRDIDHDQVGGVGEQLNGLGQKSRRITHIGPEGENHLGDGTHVSQGVDIYVKRTVAHGCSW